MKFDDVIRAYAPTVQDFVFVQIGANDGRVGDPLHHFVAEYGWRGVLVEPQKSVFEQQLLPNYRTAANLSFENVAIDRTDGTRELYKLSFSSQRWATGISSFVRSHLELHIDNGHVDRMVGDDRDQLPASRSDYITSETVVTMTFDSLLAKYEIDRLDLLQMDAEGYDYELLQMFDFGRIRPAVVQFEQHVMSDDERRESRAMLDHHGYVSFVDYINIVAVQRAIADDLGLGL